MLFRLEHPNKLLHTMFEKLYDDEIISEDAFFIWEKNDDPSEQVGPLYNSTNHLSVTIFNPRRGRAWP